MFAVSREEGSDALSKVDPEMWMTIAQQLNCGEANAVAAFLRSRGTDPTEFLQLHAADDDEGDAHHRLARADRDLAVEIDRALRSAVGADRE